MPQYMLDITYLDKEMNFRHTLYRTLHDFLNPKLPTLPENLSAEAREQALHEWSLSHPHEGCTHIKASLIIGRCGSWRKYTDFQELHDHISRHAGKPAKQSTAQWLPGWLYRKLENKEPVRVLIKLPYVKKLPWSIQEVYDRQGYLYLISVESSGQAFLCSDPVPTGHISTHCHIDAVDLKAV